MTRRFCRTVPDRRRRRICHGVKSPLYCPRSAFVDAFRVCQTSHICMSKASFCSSWPKSIPPIQVRDNIHPHWVARVSVQGARVGERECASRMRFVIAPQCSIYPGPEPGPNVSAKSTDFVFVRATVRRGFSIARLTASVIAGQRFRLRARD